MFQERLNTMVQWFDQWNESGQTVALFKMLTRLAPTQARFVAIALEHSLTECAELALREQEANNPGNNNNVLFLTLVKIVDLFKLKNYFVCTFHYHLLGVI